MNGEEHANKLKTGNQGNRANMGANQAKMHTGKMGGGGNRPHPSGQQQQQGKKKKPGER